MNATERGRRSDSLFYDTLSRRELCDKIAFLESDLEDSKLEMIARDNAMEPDDWYRCPWCGCTVGYVRLYGGGLAIMMDDYQIPFDHCPQCGAKVNEKVQEDGDTYD